MYYLDTHIVRSLPEKAGALHARLEDDARYWYVKSAGEVMAELGVSHHGLPSHEAALRLERHGYNLLAKEKRFNPLRVFIKKFCSLLIFILLGSALISLFSGHIIEFYVIAVIIIITVSVDFIQEYHANQTVEALGKLTPKTVEVVRDGRKHEIHIDHLVPGDIVLLSRGDIVPADMRIMESGGLMLDESMLTGESSQKPKVAEQISRQDVPLADRHNMVFAGTSVTSGHGKGIVVETGLASEIGKISKSLTQIADQQSPLQKKIAMMSRRISLFVIGACVIFFFLLLLDNYALSEAMLLVGAMAVSGIPESFPLALTLALTSGIRRMAKDNAIVKDLSSVETLGTTTVICTDKTGTLTENKMRVAAIHFPGAGEIKVDGHGYEPVASFQLSSLTPSAGKQAAKLEIGRHDEFFKACLLCNTADIMLKDGDWQVMGEPTEGALLSLAKSAGYDDALVREENQKLHEIPFDPLVKYMVSVVSQKNAPRKQVAYLKGAAERVLSMCSEIRAGSAGSSKVSSRRLTPREKAQILATIDGHSGSYRIIALASKQLRGSFVQTNAGKERGGVHPSLASGYVFEGYVALEDPIRKDVYASIQECQNAGIRVVMITGDHKSTAISIGRQLGILHKDSHLVIEGQELDTLTDVELDARIGEAVIFSRATPEHKLRIVSSLQRKGEIVAMTGDGVNDAPALKKADIGVAMGRAGTDVAREASRMILADDNFSTIVRAVKEGRTIYSNIRRFVYYLITGNFAEVSIIIFAVLIGIVPPLTPLMILFINLLTSTFPSLALSVEPTHHKVMRQRPRDPKERLLSSYVLLKILVLVPLLLFGTIALFLWELNVQDGGIAKARTMALATIVMFELFHVFNARSLHQTVFNKHFFSNKYIFLSLLTSFSLLMLVIHTTLGQSLFGTVAIHASDWLIIFVVSMMVVVVSEVIKRLIKSEFDEQKALRGVDVQLE